MLDWTTIGRPSISVPGLGRVSNSDEGLAELILRVGPSEFFGRLILERPVRATLIRHYTLVARPQWSYEKEGFLVVGMIGIH